MAWFIQASQIASRDGTSIGQWRMTATSDEDGGGPFGDMSHSHSSAKEAEECDLCDAFVNQVAGFPFRKHRLEIQEQHDREEYERLKKKFGESC